MDGLRKWTYGAFVFKKRMEKKAWARRKERILALEIEPKSLLAFSSLLGFLFMTTPFLIQDSWLKKEVNYIKKS